ncbi:MAG: DUF512 domain-containing protein, partial [Candidatus Zixiibacteriota bacterium]
RRVMLLTGRAAYPFFSREILPYVRDRLGLGLDIGAVDNKFWGDMVTVSGLLTGKDLLGYASGVADSCETFVLPPNCLNDDRLFLDDMSLDRFRSELGREVVVGRYNLADTLREVFV